MQPGDETRLEAFLRPRVESSLFLLSNMRRAGLEDRGLPFEGTYFVASVGGRVIGVIAQFWQGNLVFQAPEYLEELLTAVRDARIRPIRGLLGLAEQVDRACDLLDLKRDGIQFDEKEGLFALELKDLRVPEELASGRIRGRRAEWRDLDTVAAWRLAYHLEALGSQPTPELEAECRADMVASLERGGTWVLEDGGELVASTSFNATLDEAVQVGGVWTPPERRRRGYGRAVVAVSLIDARNESVERAILFTGEENVGAVKAYAALGFRRIGDHRIILLRPS